MQQAGAGKRFLFLQGPHGPFFASLARRLSATGAEVCRVGFNAGDALFARGCEYIAYHDGVENWAEALSAIIETRGITDVVCYGASRHIHRIAADVSEARELTFHAFEEGYLRPYWVTYERGGANAGSPLMHVTLDQMQQALAQNAPPAMEAPDGWGDMRQHMFWGAAYHAALMLGRWRYPAFRSHRAPGVPREFWLHFSKLMTTPVRALARSAASARISFGGFPYHLVMLQLAHDANFRDFGPFPDQESFINAVMRGFSGGAPRHHHLVIKAHPLEDGREPLRPLISRLAKKHGIGTRVHYVSGGKLARLLDTAKSAVTVNSTAAEQALWRGLPLFAFGEAVYKRDAFVSNDSIEAHFRSPMQPDRAAYLEYRRFLLATSQVAGGFYAWRNRRKLLRQLPDLMLAESSAAAALLRPQKDAAARVQHLRSVL